MQFLGSAVSGAVGAATDLAKGLISEKGPNGCYFCVDDGNFNSIVVNIIVNRHYMFNYMLAMQLAKDGVASDLRRLASHRARSSSSSPSSSSASPGTCRPEEDPQLPALRASGTSQVAPVVQARLENLKHLRTGATQQQQQQPTHPLNKQLRKTSKQLSLDLRTVHETHL